MPEETEQPKPIEYLIITLPGEMPETRPEDDPIVAIVESLLLHTPPDVELVNKVVVPVQMEETPVLADKEITFTV
jgi:hypothetical protein